MALESVTIPSCNGFSCILPSTIQDQGQSTERVCAIVVIKLRQTWYPIWKLFWIIREQDRESAEFPNSPCCKGKEKKDNGDCYVSMAIGECL